MKFRDTEEIKELLSGIKGHGVKYLNFTFYGTREYHDKFAGRQVRLFVPHEEGRGVSLNVVRFSKEDYQNLSEKAEKLFNVKAYKTEGEWVLEGGFKETENRALLISLMPANIEKFENMSFEAIITYVEELDEAYYSSIPTLEELVKMYGNPEGNAFFLPYNNYTPKCPHIQDL